MEKRHGGNQPNYRTGISAGDLIHISLESDSPVVSVLRKGVVPLLFELDGSEEKSFDNFPADYDSCLLIMRLISEITGLQAREIINKGHFVEFEMEAGDRLISGRPTKREEARNPKEKFVLIITNDESHWLSMTEQLKEIPIAFYPKTLEEFNDLRTLLAHYYYSGKKDLIEKSEPKIWEIINNLPEGFFCLINSIISDGDFFGNIVSFSSFYEHFLRNNSAITPIVYFPFADICGSDECLALRISERQVINYCVSLSIACYYWRETDNCFLPDRKFRPEMEMKKLSLKDILVE